MAEDTNPFSIATRCCGVMSWIAGVGVRRQCHEPPEIERREDVFFIQTDVTAVT